ncbi:hypothetical protein DV736_g6164, partial [Chaetothyriales sp. CBS 134916]
MRTAPASATSSRYSCAKGRRMGHRRTQPAESNSLPLPKKQKLLHTPDRVADNPDSAKVGSLSQQESLGSGSAVGVSKWFDSANQHVESGRRTLSQPSVTDDPPFYLNSHQALIPNNFVSSGSEELYGNGHRNHVDSENEDLRGVIDDLTIENKRLKQLLKIYRTRPARVPDAQDKVFELRVHGLPTDKKRELEQLLRSFATSANLQTNSVPGSSATATYGSCQMQSSEWSPGRTQQGQPKRPHTDSGYASNSNSVLNSAAVPNAWSPQFPISKSRRNKIIKSYLHDIPDTLLPRQPLYMTDRAKMALVVCRLEQFFTGNTAAPGEHMQPTQQQEVSNSAARADASGSNQPHGLEGSREAHMLPQDTKLNLDALNQEPSTQDSVAKLRQDVSSAGNSDIVGDHFSRPGSPDQRPTRPLDLDVHRAQVAADNMEYLRHLGLTTPRASASGDKHSSWIYLNLLISMAQLHTINVTPTFIRRAVRKMSTKLELSADGHKVRWKGGLEGTTFTQEEEGAIDPSNNSIHDNGGKVRHRRSKRTKTTSSSNNISERPSSEAQTSGHHSSSGPMQHISAVATAAIPTTSQTQAKSGSAIEYQPLFYKGNKYAAHGSYLDSTCPSHSSSSSSAAHVLSRRNLNHYRNDEGIITFFSTPHFCSDASADSAPTNWKLVRPVFPGHALGIKKELVEESSLRHHDACYFTPQFAAPPYGPSPDEPLIAFRPTQLTSAGNDETQPMELPVSGLGGVNPEDNFALDVKVGRFRHQEYPSTERTPFHRKRKRKRYSYRILGCETLSLQASKLPPPSYLFFTPSSLSDSPQSFLDSDSETSVSSANENFLAPAAFLNHWESCGTSDDEMGGCDSLSLDILTMAQGADLDSHAVEDPAFRMASLDDIMKPAVWSHS